jgi:replicative DNA helicase
MLTGGEGGGKTTFMRQIAICAAAGVHPTTFRTIDPVRVLVIDAENNRRQWRRQAARIAGAATRYGTDPAQNMHLTTIEDMPKGRLVVTDPRDAAAVHRLIDQHAPDLLVIGPMYKLTNRAITSDDDAAPLITALDGFRGRGVTLAIEAHAGHALGAGGERDLRPRGSSALLGWPEFGFGLRRRSVADGGPADDAHRMVDVVRWRGDRETGRKWPDTMYADPRNPFPWTPEDVGPATIGRAESGWVA